MGYLNNEGLARFWKGIKDRLTALEVRLGEDLAKKLDKPIDTPASNALAAWGADSTLGPAAQARQSGNYIDLGGDSVDGNIGYRAFRKSGGIPGYSAFFAGASAGVPSTNIRTTHSEGEYAQIVLGMSSMKCNVPIVGNPTRIWSGSATEGHILSIPGLGNYSLYAIRAATNNVVVLVMRDIVADSLTGGGLRHTGANQVGFVFNGTYEGEKLTLGVARTFQHASGGAHTAATVDSITQIWGII